jgi:hypothetical protein
MTTTKHYLEHNNLSLAWGQAFQLVTAPGRTEVVPLIVSITGFDAQGLPQEEPSVRTALDAALKKSKKHCCHSVANSIFPEALWNPAKPRNLLYERYWRAYPKIKRSSKQNKRGQYFERLISGGPDGDANQLEFVLGTFNGSRGRMRRSVLQAVVFDPRRDHLGWARLGFPCLQHVTFAPEGDGLCVNAFYATQFMFERAYGNYLGLCRLGRFVAHELGLRLNRVTCFAGIAKFDAKSKAGVKSLVQVVEHALLKDVER